MLRFAATCLTLTVGFYAGDEEVSLLQVAVQKHANVVDDDTNGVEFKKLGNKKKCQGGQGGKLQQSKKNGQQCRDACKSNRQCNWYAWWSKGAKNSGNTNKCILYKTCPKVVPVNKGNQNVLFKVTRTKPQPKPTAKPVPTTTATTTVADTASAVGDPHISSAGGRKFDLFESGHVEMMTIPANASSEEALLKITGETEKSGERINDLWIRRVHVSGKWLDGEHFSFKTGNGNFGAAGNYLARKNGGAWVSPQELLKVADGKMSLALHDETAPKENWEKSSAQDVVLSAGPLKVQLSYATSKKDDKTFNHFDVHLHGLQQLNDSMSGVLAF